MDYSTHLQGRGGRGGEVAAVPLYQVVTVACAVVNTSVNTSGLQLTSGLLCQLRSFKHVRVVRRPGAQRARQVSHHASQSRDIFSVENAFCQDSHRCRQASHQAFTSVRIAQRVGENRFLCLTKPLLTERCQRRLRLLRGQRRLACAVRRGFCHSAARPSASSRHANSDGERAPAEWQSRRRLVVAQVDGGAVLARPNMG